jgi:hypothetical protein
MGPPIYCVRDAGKWKAAICCFLRGQTEATVQWTVEHASTVRWIGFLKKISVVNWFYSHCSREREQQFFLFFFKLV